MGESVSASVGTQWSREEGGVEGLILLVGASPLPNLVATLALQPRQIALICSAETEPAVIRLRDVIKRHLRHVQVRKFGTAEYLLLDDAYRARAIRARVDSAMTNLTRWTLLYTGGTKAMATHIHIAWREKGGPPGRACYLADRLGALLFDDGSDDIIVDEVSLDIRDLADLHGLKDLTCTLLPLEEPQDAGYPTCEHATAIWASVRADPSLAGRLKQFSERLKRAEVAIADLGSLVSGVRGPAASVISPEAQRQWTTFLDEGSWFEWVVGSFVDAAGKDAERTRHQPRERRSYWNVRCNLPGRKIPNPKGDFQLDVAQVAGARLYALSCTTSSKHRKETKGKVFEVMERARQIGGHLARSAVVSLHDDANRDELRSEILNVWSGDQLPPHVFGLSDLKAWQDGDFHTLTRWLQS